MKIPRFSLYLRIKVDTFILAYRYNRKWLHQDISAKFVTTFSVDTGTVFPFIWSRKYTFVVISVSGGNLSLCLCVLCCAGIQTQANEEYGCWHPHNVPICLVQRPGGPAASAYGCGGACHCSVSRASLTYTRTLWGEHRHTLRGRWAPGGRK